jgi:hypothetical protein
LFQGFEEGSILMSKMKNLGYALSTVAVFVGVQILVSGCMASGGLEVVKPGVTAREFNWDDEAYDSETDAKAAADAGTGGSYAYWVTYEWDPARNDWVNVENPNDCHDGCSVADADDNDNGGGHDG